MADYHIPLLADGIYHLVSRANGNEKIFIEERNYPFFIRKFKRHILPIADVFSYCLLPDHFHFLLRIKPIEIIQNYFGIKKPGKDFVHDLASDFIMERFYNLLNSNTKYFNKTYDRKGALFIDYLIRVEIEDEIQFCSTASYIHKNPVHHEYCKSMNEWRWSSYNDDSFILKEELISWFGGEDTYIKYHNQAVDLKNFL